MFTSLLSYMSIVTLTFDLWPTKSIGSILSLWLTCMLSLMKTKPQAYFHIYKPFHWKTNDLVRIFDFHFFAQKLSSFFLWSFSEMIGPCVDLLQRYDVINIRDNVKILSYCNNKILFYTWLLILLNEGRSIISNSSNSSTE